MEATLWQQLIKCINLEEIIIFSNICTSDESLNAFTNMFQRSNIRLLDLTCKQDLDSPPREGTIISDVLGAKTPQSKLNTIQTIALDDFQEMLGPLQQPHNAQLGLLQLRIDSIWDVPVPDSMLEMIPSLLGLQNLQFLVSENMTNIPALSQQCAQNLVLKNVTMINREIPESRSLCINTCERNAFLSEQMAPILTSDAMERLMKTALEWESKRDVLYHFLLSFWVGLNAKTLGESRNRQKEPPSMRTRSQNKKPRIT